MPQKRVLITGAAGRIGTALRPLLRPTYRLRLVDNRPLAEPTDDDDFIQADTSDLAAMERACDGVDAVLHLAGNPNTAATWDEVRTSNIESTYCIFEAARRAGAGKVILASTNHVMGFYQLEGAWPIGIDGAIRPDSLYGVSKAFGEALARYYADAFGMSMICLRIGWFTPRDPTVPGLQSLWISARDLAQVVGLCIETPRRFGIYNGTSNNSQRHWDLQATRDELGYAPQDDVTMLDLASTGEYPPELPYVVPEAGVLRGAPPRAAVTTDR
jgi:nucleoside-diphosphate-sugar epimerase